MLGESMLVPSDTRGLVAPDDALQHVYMPANRGISSYAMPFKDADQQLTCMRQFDLLGIILYRRRMVVLTRV